MATFLDSLKSALEKMVTLEIITVVGETSVEVQNGQKTVKVPSSSKAIVTRIDLIQGNEITSMDPSFLTGDLEQLRDFHSARVSHGLQTVKDNVEALEALAKLAVSDIFKISP